MLLSLIPRPHLQSFLSGFVHSVIGPLGFIYLSVGDELVVTFLLWSVLMSANQISDKVK